MQRPPLGVKMVMEAVCIMKSIKPKKVAGEKVCLQNIGNGSSGHLNLKLVVCSLMVHSNRPNLNLKKYNNSSTK